MKFIEIEGFQVKKQYYIKELVILSSTKPLEPIYYIFKAPFPESYLTIEENVCTKYVTQNLHKLQWSEGVTQFCADCISNVIQAKFTDSTTYFCLGENKCAMLAKMFPRLDIQPYCYSTFKELPPLAGHIRCLHRDHGEHCALRKTYRILLHHNQQHVL
jgi:hypothetical protein